MLSHTLSDLAEKLTPLPQRNFDRSNIFDVHYENLHFLLQL